MGNAVSGPTTSSLEFLAQISGPSAVVLSDPAWATFTSFTTPLARFDPKSVQAEIRPHTASLVYHNAQTLNCQRLLYRLATHLNEVEPQNATIGSANAVYMVRAILADLIEQLNSAQLLAFVEVPQSVLAGDHGEELKAEFTDLEHGSLIATLARAALKSVDSTPEQTPAAYLFQLEVLNLMLVMASTELYAPPAHTTAGPPPPGTHVFLDAFMQQRDLSAPLVQALLGHFITSQLPPSSLGLFAPSTPRSSFYLVRSAASTVLWLPYTAYSLLRRSGNQAGHDAAASPLADTSVSLLLALHFYSPPATGTTGGVNPGNNPFRNAMRHLRDADEAVAEDAAEAGRGAGAGAPAVPYAALFEALGRALLPRESTILLLYALLHGTPHFNEYCMARSDVDCILLPILELLYTAQGRSANQLYMLLIVLLILSQDPAFAQNVHKVPLRGVPFYKERALNNTTLGSLLVVLLLRTAHYNLSSLKDVYLHTNTLATLANLAPHMTNLSCHAAQRLVSLLHLLDKRHGKLKAQAAAAAAAALTTESALSSRNTDLLDADMLVNGGGERVALELQLYADFLRIVLEIINAILTNALPANPELVYTLLHRQDVFAPFRTDPRYAELMENVTTVVEHFGKKVDEAGAAAAGSADKILDVIKLGSRGWRRDRLRSFPELRFTYEEEVSPSEFFIPYVWSIAVSLPAIPWTLSAISAFVPLVATESGGGGEGGGLDEGATPRSASTILDAEGGSLSNKSTPLTEASNV